MKRVSGLFDEIVSFDNLFLASRKARMGKRLKAAVLSFEADLEEELITLREELVAGIWRPGPYREFTVYERKPRRISAAPYRDRVVHHALCRVVEPVFERSFISDSFACRTGKGTHAGADRFTHFARRFRYVLKTDIARYFPSIDHEILLAKVARKIKCARTLALVRMIVDGSNPQDPVNDYFPGDGLFSPFTRRRGIPIGNLTSQFFANIYLDSLDHFVKETLRCRGYLRYVDDIAVFGDDKARLWEIRDEMARFLEGERVRLHPGKTFVVPVSEGVDCLGYRIFPDHRRVRRDNADRFARKFKGLMADFIAGKITRRDLDAPVQSWIGHVAHADSWGLRERVLRFA